MEERVEYGQPDAKDYAIDKRTTSQWINSLKPSQEKYEDFSKCPLDGKKCPLICPTTAERADCPVAKQFGRKCPLIGDRK